MKIRILLMVAIFSLFASTAVSQQLRFQPRAIKKAGNLGLGVGGGTLATGLSVKYFVSDFTSFQANAGFGRGCFGCGRYGGAYFGDSISVSADGLLEGGRLAGDKNFSVSWELGAGAGLSFGDGGNLVVAASGVIGVQLNVNLIPIDFVLEFRPGAVVVPDVYLNLIDFTGHVRYYF